VPGLAVVLVGEDPASKVYVANKAKQTVEVGMNSWEHRLPAETSEADLLALVEKLNNDPACHGILVQLPLPKHINSEKVLNSLNPDKDVDGFHPVNVGRLWVGERALVPCTPTGSVILAKSVRPSLSGLDAVVIGRSNIVGKPVAALLLRENCTVTVAHSRTKNIEDIVKCADLVIAVTGTTIHYLDHEHAQGRQSTPQPGADRITVDQAVAKAEDALPGAKVVSLEMPPPNPRARKRR